MKKAYCLSIFMILFLFLTINLAKFNGFDPKTGKVKIVIWVVPWGSESEMFSVPEWAYPGIVFAYDCYRDLKVPGVDIWFRKSLNALKYYYIKNNRTVFYYCFVRNTIPEWIWRGYLDRVYVDTKVIKSIKDVVGKGERVYIGFSEQIKCLSSEKCVTQLIQAYSLIKEHLPLVKIFYYGGIGDSFTKILYLYSKMKLDLVGYDIWEYSALGGKLRPNLVIITKLLGLVASLGNDNIFVGEIGFRRDDSEAYINPWDWSRKYGRMNESADALYYDQILKYLVNSIKPEFIGIWSCNDEHYAICEEKDVQDVLKKYAKKE